MRLAALLLAAALVAANPAPSKPGPREKCPVCGMFVAKYPDWLAGVVLRDGSRRWFDGAKDLLRFWLDPGRYLPGLGRGDLTSAFVTDYYSLAPVELPKAFFVLGSDVYGPMGRELIPFARREEAEEFLRDHRGQRILKPDEVTPELLRGLDQ
jgi:copper chaperone NosL